MSKTLEYSDPVALLPFFFQFLSYFYLLVGASAWSGRMVGYVMDGSMDE